MPQENPIDASERHWRADRDVMTKENSDLFALSVLHENEHQELMQEWYKFLLDPSQENKEELFQEVADNVLFLTALVHNLGSTIEATVMEKRAYNMARYAAVNFKDGPYDEAREKSRTWVKERNFRDQFYERGVYTPVEHPPAFNSRKKQPFTPVVIFDSRKRQSFSPIHIEESELVGAAD